MVKLTRPSDYGPLTLREADGKRPWVELPKMQFNDGDLIIKLGLNPEEWLVVHSAILREASPYFQASFSEQWEQGDSKPEMVFNPTIGKDVPMRCRALRFVEGTYLLEREDTLMELEEDAMSFPESSLALPGWPKVWPKYHCSTDTNEDESKRAMHVLFALLYGAKLDYEQICGCYYRSNQDVAREILSKVVITCAYAEYWGCLDLIGPRLLTVLQSDPYLWNKVTRLPEIYLALAVKLEDATLYFGALRHSILSADKSGDWKSLAKISGLDIADLRAFYEPHLAAQHKEVEPKIETIVENLRTLQLQSMRAKDYGGGWHDAKTRFLDALPFKPEDRSEDTKAFESVDYLARAIYGEYLVYKLDGEAVVDSPMGGPRTYITRDPSASLIQDIVEAAEQQDPSHLFDAAAGVRFASMYNFSVQQRHQLHLRLRFLVREANYFVKAAFPVKTFQGSFGGKPTKFVHTRAYLSTCYTYMAVPDRVPWKQHKGSASSDKGKAIVPGIGVADASPEWISTLTDQFGGQVEENEEDEIEVVGANWEAGFEPGAGVEVEGVDR